MNALNERVKQVVEQSGLNKTQFAKRVNVHQSYISNVCSGKYKPSARLISSISKEFHVNNSWLRTGRGAMYRHMTHEESLSLFFKTAMASTCSAEFQQDALPRFYELDEAEQIAITRFARHLLDSPPPDASIESKPDSITFLHERRLTLGLTGDEVVEKLEKMGIAISKTALYGYESGKYKPSLPIFVALCDIYGIQNKEELYHLASSQLIPGSDKIEQEKPLNEKLRDARNLAGLTQKEVAEYTGLTYQAIGAYERGINSVNPDTLKTLSVLYGTVFVELLEEPSRRKGPGPYIPNKAQALFRAYNRASAIDKKIMNELIKYYATPDTEEPDQTDNS